MGTLTESFLEKNPQRISSLPLFIYFIWLFFFNVFIIVYLAIKMETFLRLEMSIY